MISDVKDPDPTYTSSPIQFWKYLADIKNISNMYPYGKSYGTNAIYNASEDYRYGFNGMEKAKEVDDNTLTSKYRNADLETGNWWSRDPKESEAPSNSPYIMMGNNPITMIDPNGDKEYKSYASYVSETGNWSLASGDWLMTDRELMNGRFQKANEYNLDKLRYGEYTEISQRYAFYRWFQILSASKGFETQWAGAAMRVAFDVEWLDTEILKYTGASNKDLAKFANEGNEAIFNDVFPKLRKLINGSPLKGEEARSWDFITLAEEQYLVQPLYIQLLKNSKNTGLLKENIYQSNWESWLSPVFTASMSFPNDLNVFDVEDRWRYGILNMGFENYMIFGIPGVSDYYRNGGSLAPKSSKGGKKLDNPLAPAKK